MNNNLASFKLATCKYVTIIKGRNNDGGGVALMIRDDLPMEEITLPIEFINDEIVGCKIQAGNQEYCFFSYYAVSEKINSDVNLLIQIHLGIIKKIAYIYNLNSLSLNNFYSF